MKATLNELPCSHFEASDLECSDSQSDDEPHAFYTEDSGDCLGRRLLLLQFELRSFD